MYKHNVFCVKTAEYITSNTFTLTFVFEFLFHLKCVWGDLGLKYMWHMCNECDLIGMIRAPRGTFKTFKNL